MLHSVDLETFTLNTCQGAKQVAKEYVKDTVKEA